MSTYKIIEGLPKDVETEVSRWLGQGWRCNGNLFHRLVDGNSIAVQGIMKPAVEESNPKVYSYRLFCKTQIDFSGLLNSVYYRAEPPKKFGWFNYMIKIKAHSKEDAEKALLDEVSLQHSDESHSATPVYLSVEYYV